MNNLAIIPARGGSKRIHRKNIKDFLGKPIIAYSIEAALNSRLFDEVMVSTDDKEIAEAAIKYGAVVPFYRSKNNSNDYATLADVLLEVLQTYEKKGKHFENVCCILPTAPLITSEKIELAYSVLNENKLDSVCPVVAFSYPIFRALELNEKGNLTMIWPEHNKTRSQDLKPTYHDSGSFYWIRTKTLQKEETLFSLNGGMIILSETEVQDIDNEVDWKLAEIKFKLQNGQA